MRLTFAPNPLVPMNHYHPGQRALRASEFVPNKMLELIKNDLSWTITQRILESHAAAPPFADFGPYLEPLMFTLYTGKHRSKTSSMFIEAGRTEYPEHFEVCYLCQLTIWGFGEAVFALARERIRQKGLPQREMFALMALAEWRILQDLRTLMSEETGLTMDFEYIDLVGSSKDQNPEGPSLEDMCKSLKSGGQVTPWDLFPLLYVAHDPAVAHR